ncbi:hypothetical protein ACFYXD_33980 [Streptomyces platensis]
MCSNRTWVREFDTPGENIDVEYFYCVAGPGSSPGGKYRGEGSGRVLDGGGLRKVDTFIVETRLERGSVDIYRKRCNFTKAVNAHGTSNIDCNTKYGIGRHPRLTGDGRIYINIDGDGRSGTWYNLPGSAPLGS